jgi:hypothetical protein
MNCKNNFTVLLFVSLVALMLSCSQAQNKKGTSTGIKTGSSISDQNVSADKNRLVGNWERTDYPYKISISAVQDDGNLKAGYFNPKSINVGKATWNNADGILKIYVELRDVNYPGSNYKLSYNAEKDALAGEYFQAVQGITLEVAFTRAK